MISQDKGKLEYNESQLISNTNKISESAEKINSDINNLKQLVDEMSLIWSGNAQKIFTKEFLSTLNNIAELNQIFIRIGEDYQYALSTYRNCEIKTWDIINATR